MTTEGIRSRIKEYILKNFVFEENGHLGDDQSLMKSGVIDSTGILELISFAEEEFGIKFADNELVGDNFDTINLVTSCVSRKLNPSLSLEEKARPFP